MKRHFAPLIFLLVLAPLAAFADGHLADELKVPFFVEWLEGLRMEDGEPNEWAKWIGRFHLLVLHLPIGFLFATFLLELYGIIRRKHDFRIQTRFLLGMTVIVTWIAIATGLLFSLEESDGIYKALKMELLSWHGTGALILGVFVTLAYFFKRGIVKRGLAAEPRPVGKRRFFYMILMLASIGMIKVVGHHGGSLVHGADFLSEPAPAVVPKFITEHLGPESFLMPQPHDKDSDVQDKEGTDDTSATGDDTSATGDDTSPPPATGDEGTDEPNDKKDPENGAKAKDGADVDPDKTDKPAEGASGVTFDDKTFYASIIEPIFENSCNKCHGADPKKKPKADYDMTKFDEMMEFVKPGDAEASDLFYYIDLPIDDDEHMPPEGKAPQLTDLQKEQVRWWIDNGAEERGPLNEAPKKLQTSDI